MPEPKATWRGTIQFGLASVPVGAYTAVRSHAVALRSVHRGCGGAVRLRKVCEIHGAELSAAEIQRAAPSLAPIDDSALDKLTGASDKRVMEVRGFIAAADLPLSMLGKPYHIVAEPAGRRAYTLLRAAMAKTRTLAVVEVTFNSAPALAVLRPDGPAIEMQLIAWPDEMVSVPNPTLDVKVAPRELSAASELIGSMRIDLSDVHDTHNEALTAMVATLPAPEAAEASAQSASGPVDLMATLEASVKAARKPRAGKGGKR